MARQSSLRHGSVRTAGQACQAKTRAIATASHACASASLSRLAGEGAAKRRVRARATAAIPNPASTTYPTTTGAMYRAPYQCPNFQSAASVTTSGTSVMPAMTIAVRRSRRASTTAPSTARANIPTAARPATSPPSAVTDRLRKTVMANGRPSAGKGGPVVTFVVVR